MTISYNNIQIKQYKVCDLKYKGYICQITLPLCMIKFTGNRTILK